MRNFDGKTLVVYEDDNGCLLHYYCILSIPLVILGIIMEIAVIRRHECTFLQHAISLGFIFFPLIILFIFKKMLEKYRHKKPFIIDENGIQLCENGSYSWDEIDYVNVKYGYRHERFLYIKFHNGKKENLTTTFLLGGFDCEDYLIRMAIRQCCGKDITKNK